MAVTPTSGLDLQQLQGLGLASAPTGVRKKELGQEEFLKLMVTQFKNQDPFKPLDNGEFLSQMAQFSQVTGLQDLNGKFDTLSSALSSNQAMQASGLLGRSALVAANHAPLGAAGGVTGAIDVPQSVGNVRVQVVGAGGQVVRTLDLGAQAAGLADFHWDGLGDNGQRLPAGDYRLAAQLQVNGRSVGAANTLVAAPVGSVTLGGARGLLLSIDGLGDVAMGDVRRIS